MTENIIKNRQVAELRMMLNSVNDEIRDAMRAGDAEAEETARKQRARLRVRLTRALDA